MQIDWITVSAQIVNFLILVWLLKRFLYLPVIRAMDRREQRIADQLNVAEEREQQADEKVQRYQDKAGELEHQRNEILARAKEEAGLQKKQMLDEARAEVTETRNSWQHQVNEEKEEFLANLRQRTAGAIQSIARKTLGDLADAKLQEQIVHRFVERLSALDRDTRKALAEVSGPVRIASAFELDPTVRGRLTRAIHEHLAEGIGVDYMRSPQLLCGIELTAGGRRLSWNLADYMDELGSHVEETFSATEPVKNQE